MKLDTRTLILMVIIIGISGASLTLLAFLMIEDTKANDLWVEVGKTGLAIVSIGIVGGLVSWIFRRIDSDREENKRLNDYRHGILRELQSLYRTIKDARRHLRVAGIMGKDSSALATLRKEQFPIYNAQMEIIHQTQLELERIKSEVESSASVFSHKQGILEALKILDHYLGGMISEWETASPTINPSLYQPDSNDERLDFSKLSDFTGKASLTTFKQSVSHPIGILANLILSDLLSAQWNPSAQSGAAKKKLA